MLEDERDDRRQSGYANRTPNSSRDVTGDAKPSSRRY